MTENEMSLKILHNRLSMPVPFIGITLPLVPVFFLKFGLFSSNLGAFVVLCT